MSEWFEGFKKNLESMSQEELDRQWEKFKHWNGVGPTLEEYLEQVRMYELLCGKTLDLPLKKEWYNMIEEGVKKEEYREIKPYWCKRFIGQEEPLPSQRNECQTCNLTPYTHVRFRYGYTKRVMVFELKDIVIGKGNPEWGAPKDDVFILKLGNRIY